MSISMLLCRRRRAGQTTAEYAIVFLVVIGALTAMQVYVKRGLNARLKDGTDSTVARVLGDMGRPNSGAALQYEPYYSSSDFNVARDTKQTRYEDPGGVVKRNNVEEKTTREGQQTTDAAKNP